MSRQHVNGAAIRLLNTVFDTSDENSVAGKREIPIGSAPAEKVGIKKPSLSGALSIGRFVVSRWHVCGGRGPYGYSIEECAGVGRDSAQGWPKSPLQFTSKVDILELYSFLNDKR